MRINEIFYSLQGESSYAGLPFTFVRLTGCNLRCLYCDTEYAFYEGQDYRPDEVLARVEQMGTQPVLITGGEPLVQKEVHTLIGLLLDRGYKVLLETGGSLPVDTVDPRVIKVMDVKCPSSGEESKNLWSNLDYLTSQDEVKFVIGDREDYEYACRVFREHRLAERCHVLFSPVFGTLTERDLAEWMLADRLQVRLQIQLHKHLWPDKVRGY